MTKRSQHPRLVTSIPLLGPKTRASRTRRGVQLPRPAAPAPPTRRRARRPDKRLQLESLESRVLLHGDTETTATVEDHTHSKLQIFIDGQQVAIPANLGVFNDHVEVIHTHNPHGILHVEPFDAPVPPTEVPTLGDFFEIWRTAGGLAGNRPDAVFNQNQIFDHVVDANHTLHFFVNGVLNTEYENYQLDFSDELVIVYDAIANTDPTLAAIDNVTVAAGAPLVIPLDGFDADFDDLVFTVQSSNPALQTNLMNGRGLRMVVQGFGDMVFQLFEELAPRTTHRISELAESGFYDGVIFHRVINNFVIQGGDPTGTGSGGSDLGDFDDEFHVDLQHTSRGLLSMAKSTEDTNDSQFFVTEVATRHLDFNHSIFGKLLEGESVRDAISNVAVGANDRPLNDVRIEGMTVFVDKQNRSLLLKAPEGTTGTSTITVTASDGHGGTVQRTFQVTIEADDVNSNPFLLPITSPIQVVGDAPIQITLRAQDVEGNRIQFTVNPNANLDVTVSPPQVDPVQQTAQTTLTIKRKGAFTGNTPLTIIAHAVGSSSSNSSTADAQVVSVQVAAATVAAPTGVTLLANSDTGASSADRVTQRNNTAGNTLQFEVSGVQAGAVVTLFDGATQIGQATSAGTTVAVTTNGTTTLSDGEHTITAKQTVGGLTSDASPAVLVTVDARTPQYTSSPINTAVAGTPYAYNVENDEEGMAGFVYGLITRPEGMTINEQTGAIAWTPTAQQVGPHEVKIRATDLAGNFVDQTYIVTVENAPPVLSAIGSQTVNEEETVRFTATATDPNLPNDALTFSLEAGAPAGASINPTTGQFTWTTSELEGGQVFNITVRVTDQAGLFDSETIQVTVKELNQSPVLAAIGTRAVVAGSQLAFTATATDDDQPAQTLTFSLGSGAPSGASITPAGAFTWTPTAGQAPGTYQVTVRVSDGTAEDSEQITVFVQDAPQAPSLPTISPQTINEGTELSLSFSATDDNLPHDALAYTIEIGPAGATIDPATGEFRWTPSEAHGPGNYDIVIKVTDALGLTDASTLQVVVEEVNQPPVLAAIGNRTLNEGELLTFTAAATDADLPANALAYSLAPGAPTGATINAATGAFSWQTSELDGGQSFTVTVRVSDGTAEASETITVTVAEVNQAPILAAIANRTVDEGATVEFSASATDVDLPANTISYSLDSGAPAGATIDAQTGAFRWVTGEADGPDTYTITVRASDNFGLSDAKTFTITVNEINTPPVLAEIADRRVAERTEISFTATVTDADLPANALAYSLGEGAPLGATINPATGQFSWTPSEAQGPGTFAITLIVSDGSATDTDSFTVTVTEVNDPPALAEINDRIVNLGTTLSIDVVATDPDVPSSGPLVYSLASGAPDGMAIDAQTGRITWTPTAAQSGQSFDVRVRVQDATNLSDEEVFRATVNAAPVLDEIADQTIDEETLLAISARAADNDSVTFSLGDAPAGATIDPQTGAIRWTPTESQGPGTFKFRVVATDSGDLTAERSFDVTVREVNLAPRVTPVDDQSVNAGQELTFVVAATDDDQPGNTLFYSLDPGAPAGASIDPVSGAFHWLVPSDFRDSSVDIVIRVTDDGPGELSSTITVRVALTDVGLALFTINGAGGPNANTPIRPLAPARQNASAVVIQQSVAQTAANEAFDDFNVDPLADAIAAIAGRRTTISGFDEGGVGPAAKKSDESDAAGDGNPDGRSRQRVLKPPVSGQPTQDNRPTGLRKKVAPGGEQPVGNRAPATRSQPTMRGAELQRPSQPAADELFEGWDETLIEGPPADEAPTVMDVLLAGDDATAEIVAEQAHQAADEPAGASLGLAALPIVVGEILERRRSRRESTMHRSPRGQRAKAQRGEP